tara:strand:+ start:404 stop:547 length:144 start_codon:yes stop_codon:yes gene_type:complete
VKNLKIKRKTKVDKWKKELEEKKEDGRKMNQRKKNRGGMGCDEIVKK